LIRTFVVSASLLLAAASPAVAQHHPNPHPPAPYPHGPDHIRPERGRHTAMHAAMQGTSDSAWVRFHENLHALLTTLGAAAPTPAGTTSAIVLHDRLWRWTESAMARSWRRPGGS